MPAAAPHKPSITILVSSRPETRGKIREVQAGIEEEGLPWIVESRDNSDALRLSYEGACDSRLGVGIGITGEDMVIHYHRLPPDKPLFQLKEGSVADWRCYGANAARLVKGIYFKEADPAAAERITGTSDEMYREELILLIRRIIERVLHEG